MPDPTCMPKRTPPGPREVFTSFATATNRDTLMGLMRAQAETYFGARVMLQRADIQPHSDPTRGYRATARWTVT